MPVASPWTLERISNIDPVTILLMDDFMDNLVIPGDILERYGYQVVSAEDGENGLKRVQPELIFMDVNMSGLDEFQACKGLRTQEHFQPTPIIPLRAPSEIAHPDRIFTAGGSECWSKSKTATSFQTKYHQFLKENVSWTGFYIHCNRNSVGMCP
ncbi:MAG: hypothetical protein NPIRA03_15330 [Nitrospirales bacterium]|nr:MAG: hypothetical protein NPIRA03_15330 [Nitrospirales bacterium]